MLNTTHRKMGIGTKIFGGFIALIVIGLIIGASGFVSLNKVTDVGKLTELANHLESKVLEARTEEKNYIMKKDDESFKKLADTLESLRKLSDDLKAIEGQQASANSIAQAEAAYLKAAQTLKQLETDDAAALKDIQNTAVSIMTRAEQESATAAAATKDSIIQESSSGLKANALKRIQDVVAVGHDVLKHYHDRSLSMEDALEAIRNLHFEGNNYFFVLKEDITLLAHGMDRKLEGMDFKKLVDKKSGKGFIEGLIENAVKNGEASVEYHWTKPGMGDAIFPKVAYARYFKPWEIIIASGIYVDDIERDAAKMGSLIENGLERLRNADAIRSLTIEGRLYANYYFAFQKNAEKVAETLDRLKKLPNATEALKKDADDYLAHFTRRVKNNEDRAKEIQQIVDVAQNVQKVAGELDDVATASLSKSMTTGKTTMASFVVIGALSGIALAILLVRAITGPIKRVITGLSDASSEVTSASRQISSTGQQLAEAASEQAAAIEETSSSLEEMASMTRQNAENAGEAKGAMSAAEQIVKDVHSHLTDMGEAMGRINASSEETVKIIKTIDEIAFQTNLLALNAAVEAARAGEAGAGFAVVADEVRNLALRAADAAKNTNELIENTLKAVKHGNDLTHLTQEAFQKNMDISSKVLQLVDEIATASTEQAHGIEQINRAVSEMDRATQQNAANAEESAAASEQMNAQAAQMKKYVADLGDVVGGNGQPADHGFLTLPSPVPGFAKRGFEAGGQDFIEPPQKSISAKAGGKTCARANGKTNGARRPGSEEGIAQSSPEQLIPFDEDDMKDF